MMNKANGNTYLDDYNFVVFFPCDWDTPWRGRYLIEALSIALPNSKILCIENPIDCVVSLIKHFPNLMSRICTGNGLLRVCNNLYVYRPWIFVDIHIASKSNFLQNLNHKWMKVQINNIIKKNNFNTNSLITWFTDPFQADYMNLLDGKLKVFDCYDEFASQLNKIYFRTRKELVEKEKSMLRQVDMVLVVSDLLYENKQLHAKALHLIPNGVDVEHFRQAVEESTTIAEDIQGISHPIIGFHGNLCDRIDIALLDWLADRNKGWSFVMVGGVNESMKNKGSLMEFSDRKNVYLLGKKAYEVLPGYLKAFDVCMIPFRQDDLFSLNCSPLKLYEYLATGIPIVSSNLNGVKFCKSLIKIARSKEQFQQHIKDALQEKNELREKRIKFSEAHSWKKRAVEVIGLLEEALNRRIELETF